MQRVALIGHDPQFAGVDLLNQPLGMLSDARDQVACAGHDYHRKVQLRIAASERNSPGTISAVSTAVARDPDSPFDEM